jgi:putative ABC transport system permease protein
MHTLWRDIQYGARILRKRPAFTAMTVITLALGIGACTAIFSVVDAVLLRPLPYRDADRIVSLKEINGNGQQTTFAEPNFIDVRERNRSFAGVAEYVMGLMPVTGGSEPVRTNVAYVSTDFFTTLAVQPAVGRSFLPEEAKPGGQTVAVVSYGYWQTLLGSRSDLAVTPLRVGNRSYTVVGVMPRGFSFPTDAEIWIPIEQSPSSASRRSHGKRVIARLRDGVTLAQARADVSFVGQQLKRENGANIDLVDVALVPLQEAMTGDVSRSLLIILAAVGSLLLVACSNVANLLLAQATARQREFSLRTALGATRWRMARQFVTENLMLALPAGGIGVLLSFWGVNALVGISQGNLPRAAEVSVNGRALAFTLILSSLVAAGLGLLPLLRLGRRDLQDPLKESGRTQSSNARSLRLRATFVVTQVAMTVILVIGAGLLIKSFIKVLEIDPGFRIENAVAMDVSPKNDERPGGYVSDDAGKRRRAMFYQQALERIAALPGVTAVGGVNGLPMAGGGADGEFLIDDDATKKGYGEFRVASPGYFETIGIRLLHGRLFDQSDGPETQQVALISESLARRYWPNEDPVGKGIQYGSMDEDTHVLRIVGVVSDVREFGLEANARPTVYVHYLQRPGQAWSFSIVARTNGDVKTLVPAMRAAIQSIDRDVPINFRTLGEIFSSSLVNRRFSLTIFVSFAAVALLLAMFGIYAVTAYAVTERTREIGVRMALGAQLSDVLRLIIGQGMKSVLAGIAIGLGGAFVLTRLIAHLLFEVSAIDPLTFGVVTTLLTSIGLLACYVPARRASKMDPLVALRRE